MSKQLIFPFDSDQYPKINNFFYSSNNEVLINIIKDSICADNNENFFIYGERDSGKSFLLQAICNEYFANGRKSIYIPMAKAIDMQASMLENLNELDAVCIDDFTKFYHSTEWQIAFFNLINQCVLSKCSLYVSSDEGISEGVVFTDLMSRIKKMHVYEVKKIADGELSQALKFCAERNGINLNNEVINYLTTRETRIFNKLFLLIKEIDLLSAQEKRKITVPFVKEMLNRIN